MHEQSSGFVAVELDGQWGKAVEVPGLGTLNKGGGASVSSVSCPRTGACAAGGYYTIRGGAFEAFVVSQTG
jgi:hypothetical protein